MESLETTSKPGEILEQSGKPYQRPGVRDIDYDEYGAEMMPNARVWKRYVEEADRADKELVEGWNGMLDIILIFAALFSAISTAFVIESSKDLKPDFTERSAQTLLVVAQTLSVISKGTPPNDSDTTIQRPFDFTPSRSAIVVNTLWFLSLSLSVAVSLIAILAKDWCSSFMGGRFGSMLRQARLRQQRWDGIQQWKMKEILYVLPLLLHIALLLFAIGLSVYLWEINTGVALPVVAITSLTALFYVVTASLPLFFRFCPYTTALVRFLHPYWIAVLANRHTAEGIATIVASVGWALSGLMRAKQLTERRTHSADTGSNVVDLESTGDDSPDNTMFSFHDTVTNVQAHIWRWRISMQAMFSTDRSQLDEPKTPMDAVTSSALVWMISNCEDSKSVDMALQALAGAEQWLPRRPLWECGAVELLCQKIGTSTMAFRYSRGSDIQPGIDVFLDEATLYSRSLVFLTALVNGEGMDLRQKDSVQFIVERTAGPAPELEREAQFAHWCLSDDVTPILNFSWARPSPRYEIAAYALNSIPTDASRDIWDPPREDRQQCPRQWELVELVASGKVPWLPQNALIALLNGVAKSYFYEPSQSPIPLLRLLGNSSNGPRSIDILKEIEYAVGVGLAIAAFASGSYPRGDNQENDSRTLDTRLKRARRAYEELATREMETMRSHSLLAFGLLSLLMQRNEQGWAHNAADVRVIEERIVSLFLFVQPTPYCDMISFIPPPFDLGAHLVQAISECLVAYAEEPDGGSVADSPSLSRLSVVLAYTICPWYGEFIVVPLTDCFTRTKSPVLKELCLEGVRLSMGKLHSERSQVFDHLLKVNFLTPLLESTVSTSGTLVPRIMRLLWSAGAIATEILSELDVDDRPVFLSIIQSLHNKFTVDPPQDSLATNVDHLGFADLWLPNLTKLGRSDPKSVIESRVLDQMIEFYEAAEHCAVKPRTNDLPAAFSSDWTWVMILRELSVSCNTTLAQQVKSNSQSEKQADACCIGTGYKGEGQGEHKGIHNDMNWAM